MTQLLGTPGATGNPNWRVLTVLLFLWQPWSMASPEHPGSPGCMGPITQCTARTQQEAPATGPDLLRPGPDGHLGGLEA